MEMLCMHFLDWKKVWILPCNYCCHSFEIHHRNGSKIKKKKILQHFKFNIRQVQCLSDALLKVSSITSVNLCIYFEYPIKPNSDSFHINPKKYCIVFISLANIKLHSLLLKNCLKLYKTHFIGSVPQSILKA